MQVLRLFPDTNLFIQCRPPEDLDWSAWADFDEVHLVVCRPVQREIDNQKTRGNDRVGRQARRTHSLFREIIVSADGYRLIREAEPQVKLMVEPHWTPSPELKDRLDYGKPDDELVGCLYAYRAAHPDIDARLLTHDSGPMATAKMLSLSFVAVPDDWLKPPESTEDEQERNRLQAEVTRLRKAEPQFRISCLDDRGNETDSLTFEYVRYEPLTDDDVADLMERLRTRFPLPTDFGSRERAERDPSSPLRISGMKEVYKPASDEDIAAYTDEKYPEWLEQCESTLRNIHASLQHEAGQPEFCFATANEGSRPGKDALVTFTARGNFQIRPPQWKDEDEDREDSEAESRAIKKSGLPSPPAPPRGKWSTSFGGHIANHLVRSISLERCRGN